MIGRRSTAPAPLAEPEAVLAPKYEGGLQGVGNGQVIGWVWSPAEPDARIVVKIVLDGEIVAEGVAELERLDLAAAGKGDGAHGFVIDLPATAAAAGRHRILALAGPDLVALDPLPSFWQEATPRSAWSDVTFQSGGRLGPPVADPPAQRRARAVVAPGGWLFDADDFQAPSIPSAAEVDELAARIEATTAALAAIGVHYLPAVAGPKALVHTDIVESRLAAGHLWLDALGERLRDSDSAELFSLVPPLRDAARRVSCYHRTDADWNDAGAFFAARALAKELAKRIPGLCPPAASELHLLQVPDYLGSLADATLHELIDDVLVPVEAEVEPEPGVALDRRSMRALRMPLEDHLAGRDGVHTRLFVQAEDVRRPGSEGIRLAVVGDGMARGPLAWLAECAERTTFWWSATPALDQLELELPHAVVHLIRMRALPALLETDYGSER
jgi:SGNH hydrolase-like domain, acetyltransferase AlgX